MSELNKISKQNLFWLFQICGWSVYAIYDYLVVSTNLSVPITYNFAGSFLTFGSGFLVSSFLRSIYKSFNIQNIKLIKFIVLILIISIAGSTVWFILDFSLSVFLYGYFAMQSIIETYPAAYFISEYMKYTLVLVSWSGVYVGTKYLIEMQFQKEKVNAAELKAEIAELKVLRLQLNPHFLFNSLSSLRSLIREDKIAAEKMLSKISDFLRYSISSSNIKELPLSDEIEAIKNYLEIEKIKLRKKLSLEINIEPIAEDYPVPILLLHPLVENSIKHGRTSEDDQLTISISATVIDNWLNISIKNSGNWKENSVKNKLAGTNTGLKNVEARINKYYPDQSEIVILKNSNHVEVKIKFKKNISYDEE